MAKLKKILIVDDDQDILDILVMLMEMEGYLALGILDAAKFQKELKEFKPDLVMLDIMLGHIDGRDLCKAVKASPPTENLPVIMVSAGHREISPSTNYFSDAIIQKPFDISTLVSTVNKCLLSSSYVQ